MMRGAPHRCLCLLILGVRAYFRKAIVGWLLLSHCLLIFGYLPSQPLLTLQRSLFSLKRKGTRGTHKTRAWDSEIISNHPTYQGGASSPEWIKSKPLMGRRPKWEVTKKTKPWSPCSFQSSLPLSHGPYQQEKQPRKALLQSHSQARQVLTCQWWNLKKWVWEHEGSGGLFSFIYLKDCSFLWDYIHPVFFMMLIFFSFMKWF